MFLKKGLTDYVLTCNLYLFISPPKKTNNIDFYRHLLLDLVFYHSMTIFREAHKD